MCSKMDRKVGIFLSLRKKDYKFLNWQKRYVRENANCIVGIWDEEKKQWVEKEDWKYRTTFTLTKEQLDRQAAVLNFEGLDTYADIYLNGSLLKRTDNMFVGYQIPVKDVLREGENRLQHRYTFGLPL